MTEAAFRRAKEIQDERKELEEQLILLDPNDKYYMSQHIIICERLYKLGQEFASL